MELWDIRKGEINYRIIGREGMESWLIETEEHKSGPLKQKEQVPGRLEQRERVPG